MIAICSFNSDSTSPRVKCRIRMKIIEYAGIDDDDIHLRFTITRVFEALRVAPLNMGHVMQPS